MNYSDEITRRSRQTALLAAQQQLGTDLVFRVWGIIGEAAWVERYRQIMTIRNQVREALT